jgi:hypothetical protein
MIRLARLPIAGWLVAKMRTNSAGVRMKSLDIAAAAA